MGDFVNDNIVAIVLVIVFVGLVSLMARRLFSALKQWLEDHL